MGVEIRVPALGESIVDAVIGKWLKQEGEPVLAGDLLVDLETDKINVQIPAEGDGVLEKILKQTGETVAVNEVIGALALSNGAAAAPAKPVAAPERVPEENGHLRATRVAAAMAQENNLDLTQVQGSGPRGQVVKADVEETLRNRAKQGAAATSSLPAVAPAAPPSVAPGIEPLQRPGLRPGAAELQGSLSGRREERVRMTKRRQTIAERLLHARQSTAMLTTFNEIDMSRVMALRKRRKEAFQERHGVGLGFMSFFTRAAIGALKAYPKLNAEIQGNDIVLKRYYDIGIAVGAPEGLVVPVVRDADRMTFAEIERAIVDLAKRARENTLTLEELLGGTFTITNGGVFGSLLSTPILNHPQVGILGMHKIEERPIAVSGEVVIRPMMYVAMSYDHRIVDGLEAVGFLVKIKELIEDPEELLLEG